MSDPESRNIVADVSDKGEIKVSLYEGIHFRGMKARKGRVNGASIARKILNNHRHGPQPAYNETSKCIPIIGNRRRSNASSEAGASKGKERKRKDRKGNERSAREQDNAIE